MSIIKGELVGEGASDGKFSYPNESLGKAIEKTVQENIALYGDATWMVSCAHILIRSLLILYYFVI